MPARSDNGAETSTVTLPSSATALLYNSTAVAVTSGAWNVVYTWTESTSSGGFTYPTGSGASVNYFSVPTEGTYILTWRLSHQSAPYTCVTVNDLTPSSSVEVHGFTLGATTMVTSCATLQLTTSDQVRLHIYTGVGTTPIDATPYTRNYISFSKVYES